jgi:hypothetical protein
MPKLRLKLPTGVTAAFVRAEDETVDDEILLYVEQHAQAVAGIQFFGGSYFANCWTDAAFEAVHHGDERRTITEAVADAVALLRKYNWIG